MKNENENEIDTDAAAAAGAAAAAAGAAATAAGATGAAASAVCIYQVILRGALGAPVEVHDSIHTAEAAAAGPPPAAPPAAAAFVSLSFEFLRYSTSFDVVRRSLTVFDAI